MADEFAFHLERRSADLVADGWTAEEARRQARLEFGNPAAWTEHCRDSRGRRAFDELRQDLRFAMRAIRHRALVSAIVVVTLMFGIGISSGVFTMLSAATLRPQLPDPSGTFVRLHPALTTEPAGPRVFTPATMAQYELLRDRLTAIQPLAAWRNFGASVGAGGSSQRVLLVTCNFFEVYGVARASLGRLLAADDCTRREPVTVLAEDAWRRRFDADASVVGRTIMIAGLPVTVVGVAPGPFAPEGGAAWLPLTMRDTFNIARAAADDREDRWLSMAGRLARGASLSQAQAEADVAATALDLPRSQRRTAILVTDGALIHDPNVRGNVVGILALVMGALTALVLIVCGNVAILLLSQAAARRREMGVRLALGAGRTRLIRMLLVETLLLAAGAGVGSYVVAGAVPRLLLVWLTERPPTFPMVPDWRVFAYLSAAVGLAGVAAGLAPALESLRVDLLTPINASRGSMTRSRGLATLVAAQVAFGFVLLSGAVLFVGTHYSIATRSVGYESNHVLMPRVAFPHSPGSPVAPDPRTVRDTLATLPGVAQIAFAATAPGFGGAHGEVTRGNLRVPVAVNEVSPGFFSTISLPIVRGRALDARDVSCRSAHCVVVVSEALAARLFPAGNAVGESLRTSDGTDLQVVGIAADTFAQAPNRPDPDAVYRPWTDDGRPYQALVRFSGDAGAFATSVGAAMRQRFAGAVVDTHTLRWPLDTWIEELGGVEQLVVALGLCAAALAALGVFGVVSFAVSRREQEFGIRLALGATRPRIYAAVIRGGSPPVLAGLAVGTVVTLLTAAASAPVLGSMRFAVSPLDPRIYFLAAVALGLVIGAALFLPARRATSVDPLRSLRRE